jgi:farnesyl-diphosphate farnesyltransferase
MLPQSIQEIIIKLAKKMARGFLNKKIQKIQSLSDQNIYCYYAAGIVGYMITELFGERGYFDEAEVSQMMPLGHDFGLALQKVNIIKDVAEDMKEKRFYWPKDLLQEHGLDYKTLTKEKNDRQALVVIKEMIKDVKHYFNRCLDYIERLPSNPEGLKIFCGDNLLMAIATLRGQVTTNIFKKEIKIKREEVYAIDTAVTDYVKHRKSLRGLADMISVKPLAI